MPETTEQSAHAQMVLEVLLMLAAPEAFPLFVLDLLLLPSMFASPALVETMLNAETVTVEPCAVAQSDTKGTH